MERLEKAIPVDIMKYINVVLVPEIEELKKDNEALKEENVKLWRSLELGRPVKEQSDFELTIEQQGNEFTTKFEPKPKGRPKQH